MRSFLHMIITVHLVYQSTLKLKNKVDHFFVPLGVNAHLIHWGVEEEKITELNGGMKLNSKV